MRFVSVDVETANADMATLCQVGLARFDNGEVVETWTKLIDPESFFDPFNTEIHGITKEDVAGSPRFPEIVGELQAFIGGDVLVCHTHFDRVAFGQACAKYKLPLLGATWLDSARVARRAWDQFRYKGYGLWNLCNHIGHKFEHHDALADAIAAGKVLNAACEHSGLTVQDWLEKVENPLDPNAVLPPIASEGNPEGAFYGQTVVFTGALTVPRREAAEKATAAGFNVGSGVTKKTNYLILGDVDISRLAEGSDKSNKHQKAENLIRKGANLQILQETDFFELLKSAEG